LKGLAVLSELLLRLETLACRLLVAGLAGLLLANAMLRYAAGRPLYFAEEAATLGVVWLAFLSVSIQLARGEAIRLDVLLDLMPPSPRRWLETIWDALVAVSLAGLFVAALVWLRAPVLDFERVITLDLPKRPFFYVMPWFFFSGTVHVLARLLGREPRP